MYISNQISDRKSIALWLRRKRSPLEVGASLDLSNEQGASCPFTRVLSQHPALAVHLDSAELGDLRAGGERTQIQ